MSLLRSPRRRAPALLDVLVVASTCFIAPAGAAEIKVLSAGAYKAVVVALAPDFEQRTGHKIVVDNDTAGALAKRIEGGEAYDLVVVTPAVVAQLARAGKAAADAPTPLARVAIGVAVKAGAPRPDIGSVAAFQKACSMRSRSLISTRPPADRAVST